MKLIEDLSDEEFSKLELPFPLDTVYWAICKVDGTLEVLSNIFTDCDSISVIDYLKSNLGVTIFLNEEEAYEKLKKIIKS